MDISSADSLSPMIERLRAKHKLPALAVAAVLDGEIAATNAVGLRKIGESEAATVQDKFHIGSITKSMTATVAAMLVEEGKISWTTTIAESFSESKEQIHPEYLRATLEQLLANRGGAPADPPANLWVEAWERKGSAADQRLAFARGILARKPEATPGTKYIYSNQGYAIAGVMLENASGKNWEELMRSRLFEPLGMTSAGFGAPASPDQVDQPWGHSKKLLSGIKSIPPGARADNPPAISPAGAVHCSISDLAKYAAFHLAGTRGEGKLLDVESFRKLHTPMAGDYALGWVVLERDWAGGRALMHDGSNTMFYAVVWLAPERNFAAIAASNIGLSAAFDGCDGAVAKLIDHFLKE